MANVKLEPIASFVIVDPKSNDLAAAEQSAAAARRAHPGGGLPLRLSGLFAKRALGADGCRCPAGTRGATAVLAWSPVSLRSMFSREDQATPAAIAARGPQRREPHG